MKDAWDIAAALMLLFLTFVAGVLAGRMSKTDEATFAPNVVELRELVDYLNAENDRLRRVVEDAGLEDVDPYRYGTR